MDPGEADAAKEPQNQRKDKPARKCGECQAGGRSEQCAAHVKPTAIRTVGSAGQVRHRDGVAGKIDTADPAQRGASLALYALSGFTTGFLGPVAVGTVLDWFGGTASASGWTAGFTLIALGSTAAALAVWWAPD